MKPKKRRRRWLVAVVLLAGLPVFAAQPAKSKIIVSRRTTYIIGPLNADGTPNYVAWLDARYSAGVTAANNAAPLLLRAFGPDMIDPNARGRTLRRLGLSDDIFKHDKHFVDWDHRTRPGKPRATPSSQPRGAADANALPGESESWQLRYHAEQMLRAGKIDPRLAAWLAENAKPLELIRQASLEPRFYLPLIAEPNSLPTGSAMGGRDCLMDMPPQGQPSPL